jgi:hypothetical protein
MCGTVFHHDKVKERDGRTLWFLQPFQYGVVEFVDLHVLRAEERPFQCRKRIGEDGLGEEKVDTVFDGGNGRNEIEYHLPVHIVFSDVIHKCRVTWILCGADGNL